MGERRTARAPAGLAPRRAGAADAADLAGSATRRGLATTRTVGRHSGQRVEPSGEDFPPGIPVSPSGNGLSDLLDLSGIPECLPRGPAYSQPGPVWTLFAVYLALMGVALWVA